MYFFALKISSVIMALLERILQKLYIIVMTIKNFLPMSDIDENFDIDLGKYHFFNKFVKKLPCKLKSNF